MNLLVLCFLAVAIESSWSSDASSWERSNSTNSSRRFDHLDAVKSLLLDTVKLPRVGPNTPSLVDNAIEGIPFVQSALIVNGNLAVEINGNRRPCCNEQSENRQPERPSLPDGYRIISEDYNSITAVKFYPFEQTWNEARRTCFRDGGFLAYATDAEEESLYLQLMDDNYLNDLWVGIHDFFQDGDYSTILGEDASAVVHSTWLPGEPNNDNGPEPCVHYRRVGDRKGLNDRICTHNYAFNCKIKLAKI